MNKTQGIIGSYNSLVVNTVVYIRHILFRIEDVWKRSPVHGSRTKSKWPNVGNRLNDSEIGD